ncbi:zinc finger protein 473 isoform X2 [Dasypus novemcinctus]|uniref:zinc finger protein 473 isoform X2 n=1 Tax=Dasypus novemcinctus TaxID=9361 RepID=UPI00032881C6|nr:zinc finger protein 473 isoform X2 [Dasypus novemcinctus]
MDFTLEDWEQLGMDQGNLFWDTALDNYQDLFLLNPSRPTLTSLHDDGEDLATLVRGSPRATSPDVAETENDPLKQDFLEEGLSQEIMETFSKDGLWNSSLGEACIGRAKHM